MAEKEVKFTSSQFNELASSIKQQSKLLSGILDHLKNQQAKADKSQRLVEENFKKQEKWQKGPGLGRFPGHPGNSPYDYISNKYKKNENLLEAFLKGRLEANIEGRAGRILKRQKAYIGMTELKHANRFAILESIHPTFANFVKTLYRLNNTISAIIDSFGVLGNIVGGMARIGGILFLALKPAINSYRDTIKGIFEAGYGGKTTLAGKLGSAQVNKTMQLSTELFHETGIVETPEEMTKARTSTATALQQNILKVPDTLVKDVAFLNKAFMLSIESAAKLEADFYRLSGYSKTVAHQSTLFAGALGSLNGMNVQSLFEELASNSEEMAKNIGSVKNGFIAGIGLAQKLGISVESISKLADTFSTDFEGTMEMQAKVQTLAPGVDLSKAIYASNFGTLEQTIKALQQAVGPLSGFKDMPRGMKKMLADSFGFSVADLNKIIAGKDVDIEMPSMEEIAKQQLNSQTTSARLLGGTDGVLETLKNIYQLLVTSAFFGTPATFSDLPKQIQKRAESLDKKMEAKKGLNGTSFISPEALENLRMHQHGVNEDIIDEQNRRSNLSKKQPDINSSVIKKLESTDTNRTSSYFETIQNILGFGKPKYISMQDLSPASSLNSNNLNGKNSLNAASFPDVAWLPKDSSARTQEQPGMAQEVTFNTKRLEDKVDDLIRLMRNGGITAQVNLDGKKVSEGLISANNRG